SAYGLTFGATALNAPLTLDVANNGSAAGTLTLGALSNSTTNGITLTGPGTIVLSSPSGTLINATPITINAGTLKLGASNALGSSALANVSNNDTVGGSALVDLNGFAQSVLSLVFGGANAKSTSVNNMFTGPVPLTLGGNVTVHATGNPLGATLSGNLALG